MSVLLHLLLLVPSVASVSLSLTSGEVCEGAVATWTCIVRVSHDGVRLGWRNNGNTLYPQLHAVSSLGSGSPFYATLISSDSRIIISSATATVTNIVRGSLLECSDSDFMSPSTNVTLIFKGPVAANLSSPVFFGDGIRVSWSGATCAGSYKLSIYLSVYEVDVKNSPKYLLIQILTTIANFTIRNNDDERPPVTNCSITFDDVLKSCVMSNIIIFNITSGAKHSYNITVTNAAGTVNMNELSNQVKNTTTQVNTTMELSASIDPLAIAASPTVLGVLIIIVYLLDIAEDMLEETMVLSQDLEE
uniref:Ig-like domain-containing protein n=1 Tax=Amphimedon queenslandica TaxID=400682 RepID=A0A1X7TT66_AMPQE